ncbi:MAG: endonuclease/exonuclease/phosphatase family protein, partial [Fimbriimonadaceae bacterium]
RYRRAQRLNVRLGIADDGPDSWPRRRPRVAALLEHLRPDILGVQEAYAFQVEFLLEVLPGCWLEGVGRDDGGRAGEWSAVFGRSDRFSRAAGGTFWFSDTPDVPGSLGPGARCTRTATWARLRDEATGTGFLVVNQHWDHESGPARMQAGRILSDRLPELADGLPVVVMGDFNCGEDDPAVRQLAAAGLRNAFREASPDDPGDSFHAFSGKPVPGMIDQILVGPEWGIVGAGMERGQFAGGWPSDHFPVWADLVSPAREGV